MDQVSSKHSPGPTADQVLGIDIGGTNIDIAVADRWGAISRRVQLDTRANDDPNLTLARVETAARTLIPTGSRPLAAIGVTCPGIVLPDRILLAPNLPGWENVGLADAVGRIFGVPATLATNDVKAAALAEARFGALAGCDPGLYVNLGTGLGAALLIGGDVVDGHHRAAGEIAYLMPSDPAADPEILENLIGGKALGSRAGEILGSPTDAAALFRRTDSAARRIVDDALALLATALANAAVLLDPQRIVIGGGMMASATVIMPALQNKLSQVVPFPPELVPARFAHDASLHGAVALAISVANSDHQKGGVDVVGRVDGVAGMTTQRGLKMEREMAAQPPRR